VTTRCAITRIFSIAHLVVTNLSQESSPKLSRIGLFCRISTAIRDNKVRYHKNLLNSAPCCHEPITRIFSIVSSLLIALRKLTAELSSGNLCMHIYIYMCTRWQRSIGCLKLHAIFRKRATNYRALLRKIRLKIGHTMCLSHTICICTFTFSSQ